MNHVIEFVMKGRPGEEGYTSTQNPFFAQSRENVGEISNNIQHVNELLEEISLPLFLIDFYRQIKNHIIEYYYGNWILYSLTNIKKQYRIMKELEQHRVIDFSLLYIGMGHIIVASIDPIDNKVFFRRDGGSNGFDRVANWDFIKNYTPKIDSKYDFSKWLNLANGIIDWTELEMYLVN